MGTGRRLMTPGKTYVDIGFVDLSQLIFSEFKMPDNQVPEKVKYYGFDMSPICVARTLIIHEMMKQNLSVESIFDLGCPGSLTPILPGFSLLSA
jgi:hypothetical protein